MEITKCILVAAVCLAGGSRGLPTNQRSLMENSAFPFITRRGWGAKLPNSITYMATPVSHVVIHHSYQPAVCMTTGQCKRDMRSMQNYHQDTNKWADIGYNFAVGGEGSVYEGRGWDKVGAHSPGLNTKSIGIVLIGDYVSELPPAATLKTTKQLIARGVELGYIAPDYKLVGHRQVKNTECPGAALFQEIQTWDNFSDTL